MRLKRIPAGVYAANCYLIIDEKTQETAVVDPGGDAETIINELEKSKCSIQYILLTHAHADHTGAVAEISAKYGTPVYISKRDEDLIKSGEFMFNKFNLKGEADGYLKEGDILNLGELKIKCIETPGHTPGGICFMVDDILLTGDTLFSGSIGRTDLAGGDFNEIIQSIKQKLMVLPENIKVFPGHGPETTIKSERQFNPFL